MIKTTIKTLFQFFFLSLLLILSAVVLILVFDGPPSTWRFSDIPDQKGKVVICTGANSGIGYYFSYHMASKGANVIMACRDIQKCNAAAKNIRTAAPGATINTIPLDLSSLSSVENFVKLFLDNYNRLDILCLNAGIMGAPFNLTVDGFEETIAVNFLSHFALTAKLYPLLLQTSSTPNPKTSKISPPRVISVSSLVEKFYLFHPSLLTPSEAAFTTRPSFYSGDLTYIASKVANIFFFQEFDRRLRSKKIQPEILSVGAHPGFSLTALQERSQESTGSLITFFAKTVAQTAEQGSSSLLYAATAPEVQGGRYYGLDQLIGVFGWPKEAAVLPAITLDVRKARKLWEVASKLTRVEFL